MLLRTDLKVAEAAWRRGDGYGDGGCSDYLGILLRQRNDLPGAEAAFRRAVERGDPDGPDHLAQLLQNGKSSGGAPKSSPASTAATAGGGCLIAMVGAVLITMIALLAPF